MDGDFEGTTEPVTTAPEPSSDGRDSEIARRGYDRYLQRNCVDGRDLDDWFVAECESSPLGMLRLTEVLVHAVVKKAQLRTEWARWKPE